MQELALAGMRVLVMEDEILIAMDVEQLCHDHGATEVVVVHSLAESGIEAPEAAGFDAAILDVALSGRSTLPFAARLAAAGVPFVFATGHADSDGLFDEFPDVAVIGKPYGGATLIEALARAIAVARMSSSDAGSGRV